MFLTQFLNGTTDDKINGMIELAQSVGEDVWLSPTVIEGPFGPDGEDKLGFKFVLSTLDILIELEVCQEEIDKLQTPFEVKTMTSVLSMCPDFGDDYHESFDPLKGLLRELYHDEDISIVREKVKTFHTPAGDGSRILIISRLRNNGKDNE